MRGDWLKDLWWETRFRARRLLGLKPRVWEPTLTFEERLAKIYAKGVADMPEEMPVLFKRQSDQ